MRRIASDFRSEIYVLSHFDSLQFTLLMGDLMERLFMYLITVRARYAVPTIEETLPRRS